jgi:hypothetical protein
MREVTVNGRIFEVRGLRLSEVSATKMRKLGYGRFIFKPDLKDGDDMQERMGEIMDAALLTVLGRDGCEQVDQAGGVAGLQTVFRAIIAETYGGAGEEKNLSSAGSGPTTPGGSNTAEPAEKPTAAPSASTESLQG